MELNREQVVKALEKWMKNYDGKVTNFVTLGNAIGLIERLVAENERLQDLIKEVQQYNEAWVEDNGKLRKEMNTLLDADVVDAKAYWIITENGCVITCPNCGERLELCYPDGTEVRYLPHCPWCGKKLEK